MCTVKLIRKYQCGLCVSLCFPACRTSGNWQSVCSVVVIDYVDDDVALIASMKMYPDSMTNLNLGLKLCMHACVCVCVFAVLCMPVDMILPYTMWKVCSSCDLKDYKARTRTPV